MIVSSEPVIADERLRAHLTNQADNEEVVLVAMRGLPRGMSLTEALDALRLISRPAQENSPTVIHQYASPEPGREMQVWLAGADQRFWELVDEKLDQGRQAAVRLAHRKRDRGHQHRAVSNVRPGGKKMTSGRARFALATAVAVWQHEHGLPLTHSPYLKSIRKAMSERDPDLASAIARSGLLDRPKPIATKPNERAADECRGGPTTAEVHEICSLMFHRTADTGLTAELERCDLTLASGRSGPTVVTSTGRVHNMVHAVQGGDYRRGRKVLTDRALILDRLAQMSLPTAETVVASAKNVLSRTLEEAKKQCVTLATDLQLPLLAKPEWIKAAHVLVSRATVDPIGAAALIRLRLGERKVEKGRGICVRYDGACMVTDGWSQWHALAAVATRAGWKSVRCVNIPPGPDLALAVLVADAGTKIENHPRWITPKCDGNEHVLAMKTAIGLVRLLSDGASLHTAPTTEYWRGLTELQVWIERAAGDAEGLRPVADFLTKEARSRWPDYVRSPRPPHQEICIQQLGGTGPPPQENAEGMPCFTL